MLKKRIKAAVWRAIRGASAEELVYKSIAAYRRGGTFIQLANLHQLRLERRYGCYISYKAEIAENLELPHPVGIVIGHGAAIGRDAVIYQHVTVGAARTGEGDRGLYPQIGNKVTIFAGAKIIGSIKIGDNSVIGANAVVLKDVPPDSIAVGVPARIFSKK